jgi:hypothetical protein
MAFGVPATRAAFIAVGCDLDQRNPSWEELYVVAAVLGWTGPAAAPPRSAPPSLSPAFELKHAAGWSDERFSRFCRAVIGRPGVTTVEDDERVAEAMLAEERAP